MFIGLESKEIAISVELFEEGFQLYDNMTTYRVTLFASDGMSEGNIWLYLFHLRKVIHQIFTRQFFLIMKRAVIALLLGGRYTLVVKVAQSH